MMKGVAIRRDSNGRVLPGSTLNPRGRNQYGGRAEQLAERARALLDRSVSAEDLTELGISGAARDWLPEDATLADALVAVMVAAALGGDHNARRDLLARVWPAPKPVDLTLDGPPTTLAEFIQLARESKGGQIGRAP
jgi:hypothetical protein